MTDKRKNGMILLKSDPVFARPEFRRMASREDVYRACEEALENLEFELEQNPGDRELQRQHLLLKRTAPEGLVR